MKLSSKIKFSQNLKRYEDDGSSTTSLVCTALIGSLHIHWCGLLFYPYRRQCEKPDFRIKQYSSHTFFVLSAFIRELGSIKEIVMKKLFTTLLLLMNILPAFAYVRDDTDSGMGLLGGLIFWVIFIIFAIVSTKPKSKK